MTIERDKVLEQHILQTEKKAAELKLKVGDRIEVSNALWEWVQDEGPCSRQWFVCTVLQVNEVRNGEDIITSCIIRLINTGMEYEIQGIYQWNRYYWRWLQR